GLTRSTLRGSSRAPVPCADHHCRAVGRRLRPGDPVAGSRDRPPLGRSSVTEPTANAVDALADRFWEAILELNPTTATVYGDERFADGLEDPSEAGRAKALALWKSTRREAQAMPTDGLPVEDR